jgi:adenylate cyclase
VTGPRAGAMLGQIRLMTGFLNEIRRRNVHRVAIAYITASWLLIQVVETLFPVFGLSDASIRIVVILLAAGFVPAVILAWVFDWTSAGIQRDDGATAVGVPESSRRFDRVIMALLALAVGYLVVDKFVFTADTQPARLESIAVLAFDDLSPDNDQGWFAEGLSEELLNLLADIPQLRVAGRTSAFSFKDKDSTIPEIAEALDVRHIVEGSVRRFENQLRITVQLIEARTDTHVWSETYDRELTDIFAIQDEIAQAIVDKLHLNLLGELPTARKIDPDAYALYLQARHIMNGNLSDDNLARAIDLLEKALAIEPVFPEAISVLARAGWFGGYEGLDEDEVTIRVRKMIDDGLADSPNNGALLSWKAFLTMVIDNDLYQSASLREQAHASDPTNFELIWGTVGIAPLYGRPAIGARLGEYIVERDPLCLRCFANLAEAYLIGGQFGQAEQAVRRALAMNPDDPSSSMLLGQALFFQERYVEALDVFESLRSMHEQTFDEPYAGLPGHAETLQALGRDAEYTALRERYLEFHAAHEGYYLLVAQFYAWAGEADLAFEWLGKHDTEMTWGIRHHLTRPWYRKIHDDPRWQALLERYEMTEEDFDAIDLTIRMPPDATR